MLLAVTMLAGSEVCAQELTYLGEIRYSKDDAAIEAAGGALEFYNNAACEINSEQGKYMFSANEPVVMEWLDADRTVYIKAVPTAWHELGTADAETGAVTFITATETAANGGGSGARQTTRGASLNGQLGPSATSGLNARTRAIGDAIAVTLVKTDGRTAVYKFQMPADGSNVTVTAAFPEHVPAALGDKDYDHIRFLDFDVDATTGGVTRWIRPTSEVDGLIYVLDGTETMLGTPGEDEDHINEAWYVCLTPATENSGKGLVYAGAGIDNHVLSIADFCNVHLILADGCLMTVDGTGTGEDAISGSDRSGSLTIYRQYDPDDANPPTEGALSITGKGCGIFAQGNLTINGGQISARSTNAVALAAKDNLAIYGGKVTASAISAQNDVTLGLSAADDYIKAGSFAATSGAVKTAAGCRFVALDESADEGLPTATAIVPGGAQAHTPAAAGDGFAVSDIAGRTLRPLDGYLLGLCPGLGVDLSNSPASALAFTMTEGGTATHYYIYKENDALTLSVGGVNDGFNGTVYEAGTPVEILQENPTDPTAMPTACTEFDEDAHSMDMPAEDLKIVAYRAYKTDVNYLDWNSDENKYDSKTCSKAYILDGHDHMLYGVNGGWYVLVAKAGETSGWMKDVNGQWMLTGNGNLFECHGDVSIILADDAALSVGSESNFFRTNNKSALFKASGNLNFYTQSVPKEVKGTDVNVTPTDNRGRIDYNTSGVSGDYGIIANGSITLTNVKLTVKGWSSGEGNIIYSPNEINIIGGQIHIENYVSMAFSVGGKINLNWVLPSDEFYGGKIAGTVSLASKKYFLQKNTSNIYLGEYLGSQIAGKNLVGLVIINSDGTGSSTNHAVVSNFGETFEIVQSGDGTQLVSAMATGMFKTGEFQLSKLEGEVDGKHFDCSGIIPGVANPIWVADESALTEDASGHSTLSGTSTLGEVGLAGTGNNEDMNEKSAAASEIFATQSMHTVATGDGQSNSVDLCAKSVAGESYRYSYQNENGITTVEIDGDGITVPPVDEATKLTRDDAEAIFTSTSPASELSIVLNGTDITASSSPATISFTVNGTAPVQKIYVFHYVDDAWKIEGSGEPKTVTVTVDKLSRTRAGGAERPKASFVPMDIDPYKVLPKGAVVLFMSQNQLLSIANFQRENPDLVNKARARGSLMIDTTTPETTALVAHAMVTERAEPVDGHWYGLDGRRLPSAPTAKGVYVHRGRKVVIR